MIKIKYDSFYKTIKWRKKRQDILLRDKYLCQFYLGVFEQYGHKYNGMKLVRANTVHHIKPLKDYPELALDDDNLVSLSHEAHEIIEGRADILKEWNRKNRKKAITKEKW